ncbi:MAG: thiosulfate sulfurtransferase GlpE [Oceanospirillales bacterium]|nr:thiosulfate sulfurtransferase GlpE [Oceanospirillales bacterium]
MEKFKTISAQELPELLGRSNALLLDCRDLRDYRSGHIENALHLHEGLRESLLMRGDKHREIVIYCYHGHASEHVAEMFADFGFSEVYSLAGGFNAWIA